MNENIFTEKPYFFESIWKDHNTKTILDTTVPITLIYRTISPIHFSKSTFHVIFIKTSIPISTFPMKFTETILHIMIIIPFIVILKFPLNITLFFPFPFSTLLPIFEQTRVCVTIGPLVLTITVRVSKTILTYILIPIWEKIGTITVSQTSFPLSFISITISPSMNLQKYLFLIIILLHNHLLYCSSITRCMSHH